jgi:transcriptional regulator with XRE-family HTH domain
LGANSVEKIFALTRIDKRMYEGPFYRDLGRNLRVTRIACGKTQREIAAHLDVTFQQVQKYENGANRIPIHRLLSLAGFLEVPLSHFFAPPALS